MNLNDLRHRHSGDVWVVGSGASLSFLPVSFFDGKVVVATNLAAAGLGLSAAVTYVHSHYHENVFQQQAEHPDWVFVAPYGDKGFLGRPERLAENVVYYPHVPTGDEFTDPYKAWDRDGLVVGSSSIHGSMHLAAYLGASNVILVGADCATFDGRTNYEAYVDERGLRQSGDLLMNGVAWLERWNRHLVMMKRFLIDEYGVVVCSLLPFVNANMEGHVFESHAGRVN
jgi:hypothetical protein